ncbi:hypothetical protein EJ08DRAFT_711334 [Tothia fuscella]|uniref:Uncharacterized protein n=1 Tax=Tothia fuscella TaxID=1048955 RepID=A0A9P4P327_9PEZI|nr:hypothetical protein EJ08DRAFT_711334 [Tothia fuscella]
MSLKSRYEAFIRSPSSGALADNASINYIPTLTTINEPAAIIKHLAAQHKLLVKKSERVLSTVESVDGLCVDVDTEIEFIAGGGAYLPGLDDNFLADKLVNFPVVHIVQFDSDQKIRQIRQYWDQGSLLKQIEVIGARARNWPIRDGKDQSRLIANSAASIQQNGTSSRRSTTSNQDEVVINSRGRSHASSSTSATGDPHATLSLFQPRSVNEENERVGGPSIARRSSAKPPQRDLVNLLGGGENEPLTPRAASPKKNSNNGGAPKAGAGKNFNPIRLFDENGGDSHDFKSPEKKTDPTKYNHFDFGDGEEAANSKAPVHSKHQSQWGFEDFMTPDKPKMKEVRTHEKRTMESLGEDEVSEQSSPSPSRAHVDKTAVQDDKSPVFRPVVHQARPDAEQHFAFEDAGTPAADKVRPPRKHKNGLSLYDDNVGYQSDEDTAKQPLTQITNVNQKDRHHTFDSQFEINDKSPSASRTTNAGHGQSKVGDNTAKVLKGMNANWQTYDESPDVAAKKENLPTRERGIKLAGDGMGGNRGSGRTWGFGDDSDTESSTKPRTKGTTHKPEESKSFWDF